MDAPDLGAALRSADAAQELFSTGETVVVGVSGGPDSVALLRALVDYAPERGLIVHAAHVDHALRPDSAADAAFVAQLAADWALPLHLVTVTVSGTATGGPEAAARAARYGALAAVAGRLGARTVAVAHTADDQAETLLMNLIRGTGLAGLRGMRPVAPWPASGPVLGPAPMTEEPSTAPDAALRLVRPFLAVTHADLLAFLAARGIAAREDPSNRDPRFLRNRVRHEVLPLLATLNPRVRAALLQLADSAADDEDLLDEIADQAWPLLVEARPDGMVLDRAAWLAAAPAVQQRVSRRAARQLLGDGRSFGRAALRAMRELVAAGADGRCTLPGGLELVVDGDQLCLSRPPAGASPRPRDPESQPVLLTVPGTTLLPGGWRLTTTVRLHAPDESVLTQPWVCWLDLDSLAAPLMVRVRQVGDRLAPLGMGGQHRRLQDIFVDARVPRAERADWPLVVAGGEIVWVVGLRMAEAGRVRPDTGRVLELRAVAPDGLAGRGLSGGLSAP